MTVKIKTARVLAFNIERIAPGDTVKQSFLGSIGTQNELVFIECFARQVAELALVLAWASVVAISVTRALV